MKTGDVSKRNRHANTDDEFQFHMYFKHIFTNKSSITKLPIGSSITEKLIDFSKTPFLYTSISNISIFISDSKRKKGTPFLSVETRLLHNYKTSSLCLVSDA